MKSAKKKHNKRKKRKLSSLMTQSQETEEKSMAFISKQIVPMRKSNKELK